MKYLIFVILIFPCLVLAQVEDNFEKANMAFEQSKFDEAYIHLKNSLSQDDTHLPSKILMGKVLTLSFLYDEAIIEFYETLQRGADPNLVIEFLANSLLVENRYTEVIALSDRGLTKKDKAILHAIQAKAFNELGDIDNATSLFTSSIKLSPTNASILDAYAKFKLEHDDLFAAKGLAEDAVASDSNFTEAYRTLAAVYRKLGDTDAYLQTLNSALLIDPEQPLVLRDLVSAYVRLNQFQEAENTIRTILRNSAQDPMAKFMLSWVQSQLGKTNDSKETLEQLVNYLSLIDSESLSRGDGLLYISGIANYAAGNNNAAMQDLQTYLIKQPNDLQASLILSDIYTNEGSFATAISVLERFSKQAENELKLGSKMCRLYLQASLNHKCNRIIEKLSEQHSTDPYFISLKARALAARGRQEEALATLQTIESVSDSLLIDRALLAIQTSQYTEAKNQVTLLLKNAPDNSDYKNLLASVFIKQGDNLAAQNLLEEILSLEPEHFSARFNLSSVLANVNNFSQAKTILNQLLVERPNQADVSMLLAKIESILGNQEQALQHIETALLFAPESLDAKLEMASIYSKLGDLDKAVRIVSQMLNDNFLNAKYLSFRADLYIRSANYNAAKNDLTTLYGLYSDDFSALYSLALFQERAKDLEGAWKSIQRSAQLNASVYATQLEKLRIAIKIPQIKEAKSLLSALNKTYGSRPDLLLLNGDFAEAQDRLGDAANFYQQAIVADNTFAQALLKRYLLASKGYAPEAFINLVEASVNDAPSSDLKRHLLGDLYLERKQYADAKKHYNAILINNSYPRMPFVLNNFANIHILEGDFETAYEKARRAAQMLPSSNVILDTLGWSLTKLGKYDDGLKYLRQSFAMNTVDPATRYHLAYTLFQLNRQIEAKREIEILLKQFDNFDDRKGAVALLEKINNNS